jgi:hypothetical protein
MSIYGLGMHIYIEVQHLLKDMIQYGPGFKF